MHGARSFAAVTPRRLLREKPTALAVVRRARTPAGLRMWGVEPYCTQCSEHGGGMTAGEDGVDSPPLFSSDDEQLSPRMPPMPPTSPREHSANSTPRNGQGSNTSSPRSPASASAVLKRYKVLQEDLVRTQREMMNGSTPPLLLLSLLVPSFSVCLAHLVVPACDMLLVLIASRATHNLTVGLVICTERAAHAQDVSTLKEKVRKLQSSNARLKEGTKELQVTYVVHTSLLSLTF